uniref:Uncharacterized protein n=1 Tax=Cacopsylla melanoneura TaxID=428564 RepID=A0A8D9E914_9HEMI
MTGVRWRHFLSSTKYHVVLSSQTRSSFFAQSVNFSKRLVVEILNLRSTPNRLNCSGWTAIASGRTLFSLVGSTNRSRLCAHLAPTTKRTLFNKWLFPDQFLCFSYHRFRLRSKTLANMWPL